MTCTKVVCHPDGPWSIVVPLPLHQAEAPNRPRPRGRGPSMLRTICSVLLALAALARGLPAAAQTSGTVDDAETTAPVVIDGYTLFQVRGTRSYPAERRAGGDAGPHVRGAGHPSAPGGPPQGPGSPPPRPGR